MTHKNAYSLSLGKLKKCNHLIKKDVKKKKRRTNVTDANPGLPSNMHN